jgi:hypothetical protein
MSPIRIGVAAAVVLLAAGLGVAYYKPPLRIGPASGGVRIDVQTLGEYPTDVERVRLRDAATGRLLWDLRARAKGAQLSTFELHAGSNPAALPARWGGFDVVVPQGDATVRLESGRPYALEVWGTRLRITANRKQFRLP